MRTMMSACLAVGLACLLAAQGLAQPPQGQGGNRRGGGGGGMMGGGGLLNNKSVQQELKMTDEQIKKAKEVTAELGKKHEGDFAGVRDLEPAERMEKIGKLMTQMRGEVNAAAAGFLKPDQQKRFKQIDLQQQGVRAFADAEVQTALKLSQDQQDKIKTIVDDSEKEMRALRGAGQGQGNRQENQKKVAEMRKETMNNASAVLTDEQKQAWKELVGAPFELKREGGPGGPRGPRSRGDG